MITGRGGAGTDPFVIYENGTSNGGGAILNGNNSTGGKTQRGSDTLTSGEKTLVHLVIGDSIEANSCEAAYTVTQTGKNDNLNIYDGHLWRYSDPYLGPSTGPGSYPGCIADQVITNGKFARVITIGCSMGGATSYDFSRLGGFSHRIVAAILYCRRNGYPLSGTGDSGNWAMIATHAFGVNDSAQSYSAPQYTGYCNSCFDLLRDYGFLGKILIPKKTMLSGAINSGLQTAQDALVDNSKGQYAGPNFDSYTGSTYRTVDGTHPKVAMVTAISTDFKNWIVANL